MKRPSPPTIDDEEPAKRFKDLGTLIDPARQCFDIFIHNKAARHLICHRDLSCKGLLDVLKQSQFRLLPKKYGKQIYDCQHRAHGFQIGFAFSYADLKHGEEAKITIIDDYDDEKESHVSPYKVFKAILKKEDREWQMARNRICTYRHGLDDPDFHTWIAEQVRLHNKHMKICVFRLLVNDFYRPLWNHPRPQRLCNENLNCNEPFLF